MMNDSLVILILALVIFIVIFIRSAVVIHAIHRPVIREEDHPELASIAVVDADVGSQFLG